MTDFVYARCPGCRTVFRVTAAQLALREGQVRCGQCRAVFDANDHLVKPPSDGDAPPAPPREDARQTEAPASSELATPAGASTTEEASPRADAEAGAHADAGTPPQTAAPPEDHAPIAYPRDYEWRPRRRLREQPRALYALAVVALAALLGAQLLFEYRDALAAHAPLTRPLLDAACRVAQCEIAPLRDASALSIEASDLQADPAHKGLLKLTATVRNRAAYAIAYPYLELTLTDPADAIVARRAFPPAAYAPARVGGIAGNDELVVTMLLDASATSPQAGYRLYLFYP